MKYLNKSFSLGSTAALRRNWDAVFHPWQRSEQPDAFTAEVKVLTNCGNRFDGYYCTLARGHKGAHKDHSAHYASGEIAEWINGEYL